jgi:hypothetical protein
MNPFAQLIAALLELASTYNTKKCHQITFILKVISLIVYTILTFAPYNETMLKAFKAFHFGEFLALLKEMRVNKHSHTFSNSILSFAQENEDMIRKLDSMFNLHEGWNESDLTTLSNHLALLQTALDDDYLFEKSELTGEEADYVELEEMPKCLNNLELILVTKLAMLYARSYFSSSSSSFSSSSLSSSSEAHQAAPLLSTALFDAFEATRSSTSSAKRESTEQ